MTTSRTEDIIIAQVMQTYPMTQAIYLFGSFGTSHERPDSDIDIAVLLPHDVVVDPIGLWGALLVDLTIATGRQIDLVNLRTVNTILQFQIIEHGRRIAAPQKLASDLFDVQICSMYQHFVRERADIVAAGIAAGRFYGPR